MPSFKGKCYVCGSVRGFEIADNAVLYREARCPQCGASIRNSDVAQTLLKELINEETFLQESISKLREYHILGTCTSGILHECLKELPNYKTGEFLDGIKSGEWKDGVQCIDLRDIPFEDEKFDLIISEDVLEHIEGIDMAFLEIYRVLKYGGKHIFTIPLHEHSITKYRTADMRAVYHGDPIRQTGALVHTDFGYDINEILLKYKLMTREKRLHVFYDKSQVTDVDKDYENYIRLRESLEQFFKYNSVVFISEKVGNLKMHLIGNKHRIGKGISYINKLMRRR